jgi:hypothetical protein
MTDDATTDATERTLSVEEVMQFAWPWVVGMTVAIFVPQVLLHGVPVLISIVSVLSGLLLLAVAYVVSVVIHEALHVVGMLAFGRVPPKSISWGHRLSEGIVYVHTSDAMSTRAYRGVLALPGLALGVLPVLVGWATGSWWITIYGWLMTTSAVGDLAVLHLIRDLPAEAPVRDHPRNVGVIVLPQNPSLRDSTER